MSLLLPLLLRPLLLPPWLLLMMLLLLSLMLRCRLWGRVVQPDNQEAEVTGPSRQRLGVLFWDVSFIQITPFGRPPPRASSPISPSAPLCSWFYCNLLAFHGLQRLLFRTSSSAFTKLYRISFPETLYPLLGVSNPVFHFKQSCHWFH